MTTRKNLSYFSFLLTVALIGHSAFAQSTGAPSSGTGESASPPGIIWNQPGQASTPPANAKHPPAAAKPAPAAMAPNPDQRNVDDRKLNSLAVQFMHIDTKSKDALTKLAKVSKETEAFHKALFTRSYNAMDILKDTESLRKRIAAAQAKAAEANPAPAPTPASAPAPQPSTASSPVPLPQPTSSQ